MSNLSEYKNSGNEFSKIIGNGVPDIIDITNYEVGDVLGKGNFGQVYEVVNKTTGQKYAMKISSKDHKSYYKTKEEVAVQKQFNHPHIVSIDFSFETDKNVVIFMELCHLSLYIDSQFGKYDESYIMDIFSQIANAVSYIHQQGYSHRDLKPENVMDCSDGPAKNNWKLIDFGYSAPANIEFSEPCCTLDYIAPEAINGKYFGQPADVWALGIILYELLFRKTPFYEQKMADTFKAIRRNPLKFPNETYINPKTKHLLERMLDKDPNTRIKMPEIILLLKS